ncbi:tetratricopeptide repeat-containing protein [Breznakiellaceae bacterium SP9]
MTKSYYYIVFTDLKGFSRLSEDKVILFQTEVVPALASKIKIYKDRSKVWNTWGDAIFAAFEDGIDAVLFMLEYRNFFNEYEYSKIDLNSIRPRIAGHYGLAQVIDDPILGGVNLFGANINETARMEPITRAGDIFVSADFREAYKKIKRKKPQIKFNELGIIKLAKKFGEREVFRLCLKDEKDQFIDRILQQDIVSYLPDIGDMSAAEKNDLASYKNSSDITALLKNIETINESTSSPAFLLELGKVLKKYGAYKECLDFVEYLKAYTLKVDEVIVFPMKHRVEILKLNADMLTRLGKYEDAADIIYGLWQSGHHDSDTLSMLAAQYKRRSLYGDNEAVSSKTINHDLLNRALNLYIEAFRLNIEDYYPVINAAYIYMMLGGSEKKKGRKLAQYIIASWGNLKDNDWWRKATIAEAQLLLGAYIESEHAFKEAVETGKPDKFMLEATREQIKIYSVINGIETEVEGILEILR